MESQKPEHFHLKLDNIIDSIDGWFINIIGHFLQLATCISLSEGLGIRIGDSFEVPTTRVAANVIYSAFIGKIIIWQAVARLLYFE